MIPDTNPSPTPETTPAPKEATTAPTTQWWDWPKLPTPQELGKGHQWECTPQQIKTAIDHWAIDGMAVPKACALVGISEAQYKRACGLIGPIRAYRLRMRSLRADAAWEQRTEIVNDTSKDILYAPDGRPIPNNAAVRRAELIHNSLTATAERLAPDMYGPRQQVDMRSVSLVAHADVATIQQLMGRSVADVDPTQD